MYNSVRMQILHAVNQLIKDVSSHSLVESIGMLDEAVQFSILSQFHDVVAKISLPLDNKVLRLVILILFLLGLLLFSAVDRGLLLNADVLLLLQG